MNALLIITSDAFATREQITKYIDTLSEVPYWHACLPHCVFCTSSLSAILLAKKLEQHFGHTAGRRYLVMKVHPEKQGRLSPQAWKCMSDPDNPW